MTNIKTIFRSSSLVSAAVLSTTVLACSSTSAPRTVATGAQCASLQGGDEVLAQVYAPGAIYEAKPIQERVFKARANQPIRTLGATMYVRAQPNMNAPHLRRALACHAGSNASLHPNDPLRPASGAVAELSVREARNGFAVEVRGDRPEVGEEIFKRAAALSNQQGQVQVKQVAQAPLLDQSL